MKSIFSLGLMIVALSFCGIGERLRNLGSSNTGGSSNTAGGPSKTSGGSTAEKPILTASQKGIQDAATEVNWDDQGISWKFPTSWKKMDVKKESFNYQSPDNAFLLVNISVMPDNFPMDVSLKAYHEQALQQLKNGKYESVRMLEIDGVPGVEFVEAPPEEKDGIRRHQWIAYRTYLGQQQQLNVMTSTKGTNFDKHKDDFPAIMYSMKVTK